MSDVTKIASLVPTNCKAPEFNPHFQISIDSVLQS
jgi:hypothetical protein